MGAPPGRFVRSLLLWFGVLGGALAVGALLLLSDPTGTPTDGSPARTDQPVSAVAQSRAAPLVRRPPAASAATPQVEAPARATDRAEQVRALLDRRAAALLTRDRAGFLAGIDPAAHAFAEQQAAVFDALAEVPLGSWSYELDPGRESDPAGLRERHGAPVWVPQVRLRYAIAGFDARPTVLAQVFTFVQRDGVWLLAADSDVQDGPVRTGRALWDFGPVVAVRRERSLVLGHPGDRPTLDRLAADVDAAVPRVTEVWGSDWSQRVVVLLPADTDEMRQLVGQDLALSSIAAVATAQLLGGPGEYDPVGDRVVVHPVNLPRLGPLGRRIVLTHEVAHVAARAASGPALPAWLVEGLADHIGYTGAGVPLERTAPRTAAEVRAGRPPAALPTAEDFAGDDAARAYESAWLAVTHLVEVHGEEALLRLYRRVGEAPPGSDSAQVVRAAFADVLGTTPEEFRAAWADDVRRRFS